MNDIISRVSRLERFRKDLDSEVNISLGHVSGLILTAPKTKGKCVKKENKCC